jgi:hypothetical protein
MLGGDSEYIPNAWRRESWQPEARPVETKLAVVELTVTESAVTDLAVTDLAAVKPAVAELAEELAEIRSTRRLAEVTEAVGVAGPVEAGSFVKLVGKPAKV